MLSSPGVKLFTTQSKLRYAPQTLVSQTIYYVLEFTFFLTAHKTKANVRQSHRSFIGVGYSKK